MINQFAMDEYQDNLRVALTKELPNSCRVIRSDPLFSGSCHLPPNWQQDRTNNLVKFR